MKNRIYKLIIKRIFSSIIILLLLITFLFFLIRISPGDPAQKFLSPKFSVQLIEKVKESFGLTKPLSEQYLLFLKNLFKGNLGISYSFRQPVISVIWEYLSFTLVFAAISFVVEIIASFILAFISLKKINGFLDKLISNFTLLMYAAPSFVVGVSLIYIFSYQLNLFPVSGLQSFDSAGRGFFTQFGDYLYHLVLPVITLSLSGTAVFYKYLRDNLEDIYNQSYIWNLRSNGFEEKTILRKHVIPNAISPLISIAGVELGILFSGALITEVIFGLPGMGRLTIDSIMSRDYPLIIGCSFFAGLLIIFTNFAADILKALIDKRTIKGILN
jgi:peptide/nickel transport system permease protein